MQITLQKESFLEFYGISDNTDNHFCNRRTPSHYAVYLNSMYVNYISMKLEEKNTIRDVLPVENNNKNNNKSIDG